jgi:phage protein D
MDKHAPSIQVKIGGATSIATDGGGDQLETRGGPGIISATVDLRLDNPDMFTVEYDMMKLEKVQLLDSFKPGAEVEISMGLEDIQVLCTGEISYIEPVFDVETGYRTIISGYHKLHRLTRGQRSKTWGDGLAENQVPTNAVKDVINNSKAQEGGKTSDQLHAAKFASSDLKLKYIPQLNMSDFEFLRAIGANLEYKADPSGSKDVKFIKADAAGEPVMKLARDRAVAGDEDGSLILHAAFRLSTVQQYAAVEVRGWDPAKKKNIVQKVTSSTYNFDGTKGHSDTGTALYGSGSTGRKYVVVDQAVSSTEEAKSLAQSLFDQFSMDFLTGEVTIKGNPKCIPGKTIEFTDFGKSFSGKYLITAATHSYRPDEGYRTTIAFARNAKGKA